MAQKGVSVLNITKIKLLIQRNINLSDHEQTHSCRLKKSTNTIKNVMG